MGGSGFFVAGPKFFVAFGPLGAPFPLMRVPIFERWEWRMGRRERVVDVRATIEVDASDSQLWAAQVAAADRRFGGMFAWGRSFDDARDGLAELVLVAVEGEGGPQPDSVRIFATSRKTYSVAALKERVR
jgi:hypothetical protein